MIGFCRRSVLTIPTKKTLLAATLIAALVTIGSVPATHAQVMLSPVAVVGNELGESSPSTYPVHNLINRQGIPNFESGITDAATYLAGGPESISMGYWFADYPISTGFLDLDLGDTYLVEQIVLWHADGVTDDYFETFSVYTSSDLGFSSTTLVGADYNLVTSASAQVFDVIDSTARYVRVHVTAGGTFNTALNEIALIVSSPIPEPSAFATFAGITALALCAIGRRPRRTKIA